MNVFIAFQVVPLRPDFNISIEVYCMTVGDNDKVFQSASAASSVDTESASFKTPKRRRGGLQMASSFLSTYSARTKKVFRSSMFPSPSPSGSYTMTPGRRFKKEMANLRCDANTGEAEAHLSKISGK